jgi:alkylation response protein AidB-like acyl-CoA dehydrogenase
MAVRTEEQDGLASALRTLLADLSSEQRVRLVADTDSGLDERLWARLRDVGLLGLAVPESSGGQGGGVADLAVAFEECGRALACVPLLSASVALAVLEGLVDAVDSARARTALERLCAGERRATLALAEGRRGWRLDGLSSHVTHDADGWVVSGGKEYVLDGATADDLLVVAVAEGVPVLLMVDAATDGVGVTAVPGLDITRRIASVRMVDARATLLADGAGVVAAVAHGLDVAAVLLAAEQVGGAQRCLEVAVAYAKVREQFGVPIGSFQAIKHKCADMLVLVEGARALMEAAATALDSGATDADQLVSSAKAYCSEAYVACAGESIQIHGGIGFTWEHAAHLYLRRAKSTEMLFGSPAEHRERVVSLIEAETAARPGR